MKQLGLLLMQKTKLKIRSPLDRTLANSCFNFFCFNWNNAIIRCGFQAAS